MPISRLVVDKLRNIDHLELDAGSGVNLIVGANGSGKTSLLEALYLLGRGRSFKTSKHKTFITKGELQTTIFGEVQTLPDMAPISAGITKNFDGLHQIKVAGVNATSAAPLLELMPIQLIEPETFKLLAAGPAYRRQFIDWGVFHVEHSFFECWQRLNRCLKQRNKLLRRGKIDRSVLSVWDQEFVVQAERLTKQRAAYVEQLRPFFDDFLAALIDIKDLQVEFYPGWNLKVSLEDTLNEMLISDSKRGFTQAGPHRADLRVKYLEHNASDILSRGQQKLVICALKIAQGHYFSQTTGRPCIYLLDDLAAELDGVHRDRLCQMLSTLNCQLFITSVDESAFSNNWPSMDVKVFHVEHGKLVS
ncbi:MAG: DNA replication/repair protein RecF [Pseudomonadales bacterium]